MQAVCGAPLDVLLSRHVRAHLLDQQARAQIASLLDVVARCHGRLDWRLRAAAVEPTPRSRLLASLRLVGGLEAPTIEQLLPAPLPSPAEVGSDGNGESEGEVRSEGEV